MATMIVIRPGRSAKSICRLCFTEQEQYQSIAPLMEWIGKLTSLTITNVPNAPSSLCLECKATLEDFESFREMCLTNDRVFKDTFMQENEIKVENGNIPFDQVAEEGGIANQPEDTTKENEGNWMACEEMSKIPLIKKDASTQVTRINKNSPLKCPTCGKFKKAPKYLTLQPTLQATSKVNSQTTSQATSPAASQVVSSKATPQPTNNPNLFTCEQCGKHFVKRSKYKAHVLMHKKRYFCEYCSKGFPNTYLLKVHTRVHTGEKPFPCDLCGKSFFSKFNLKHHKQHVHSALREFSCDLCNLMFTTSARLERHLRANICVSNINRSETVANAMT